MRRVSRCVLSTLALVFIAAPLTAQNELNGAWHAVEYRGHNAEDGDWKADNVQPSLYLFLDGYYSLLQIQGDEPRPLLPDSSSREALTYEQLRSTFIPFHANSGTYQVDGATLTVKPMVAEWPNYMESGSATTCAYRIEGDKLILTYSGEGWETVATLERLE